MIGTSTTRTGHDDDAGRGRQDQGDFRRNVDSVHALVNFDRFVMDFAIEQVSRLHDRRSPKFLNPADNGEYTLLALRNVRANDSLRTQYRLIANQGADAALDHF